LPFFGAGGSLRIVDNNKELLNMKDNEVVALIGIVMVSIFAVILLGYRQYEVNQTLDRTQQRVERTEKKLDGILGALDTKP
jgi:cell division protein FtsL